MLDLTLEEKRWRAVLENATVGVWNLTPQSEIVHYSPGWKAKLGFPSVDATDSTSFWRSRVHPDDFAPMLRALRLHLDGYTKTYEMRFRLRDGNFRYVAVKSRGRVVERDQHGIALRVVGTMVDPTGRMSAPAFGPAHSDRSDRAAHGLRAPLESMLESHRPQRGLASVAALAQERQRLSLDNEESRRLLHQVSDLLDVAIREGTASAGVVFPAPARPNGRA
jgi:PAS domain S-box-containing protein